LIVLSELINGQLTSGLEKLIAETSSIFWVGLEYRLRSRDTVPLQGSGGWLTFHLLLFYYFTVILCVLLFSGRAWFSVRHLGCGSDYVRNSRKVWTMSL